MLPLLLSSSGVAGIGVNSSCMTVELCGYIAQNQGFTYFGVEGGTREQGGQDNLAMVGQLCSCSSSWLHPAGTPPLVYVCSVLCGR